MRKPHVSRQCTPVRLFGRRIQPVCEFATIERHWPPSTKGQQSCSRNALIEKSRQVRLASPVAMSFWNFSRPNLCRPTQSAGAGRDTDTGQPNSTEIRYGTGFFRSPYRIHLSINLANSTPHDSLAQHGFLPRTSDFQSAARGPIHTRFEKPGARARLDCQERSDPRSSARPGPGAFSPEATTTSVSSSECEDQPRASNSWRLVTA